MHEAFIKCFLMRFVLITYALLTHYSHITHALLAHLQGMFSIQLRGVGLSNSGIHSKPDSKDKEKTNGGGGSGGGSPSSTPSASSSAAGAVGRKYWLDARTAKDRDEWIRAIKDVVAASSVRTRTRNYAHQHAKHQTFCLLVMWEESIG